MTVMSVHNSFFKYKALCSFETSDNTHLTTQCNISEALNPQRHHCENLKSHLLLGCYYATAR